MPRLTGPPSIAERDQTPFHTWAWGGPTPPSRRRLAVWEIIAWSIMILIDWLDNMILVWGCAWNSANEHRNTRFLNAGGAQKDLFPVTTGSFLQVTCNCYAVTTYLYSLGLCYIWLYIVCISITKHQYKSTQHPLVFSPFNSILTPTKPSWRTQWWLAYTAIIKCDSTDVGTYYWIMWSSAALVHW